MDLLLRNEELDELNTLYQSILRDNLILDDYSREIQNTYNYVGNSTRRQQEIGSDKDNLNDDDEFDYEDDNKIT